jgi:hypothetical protein
LCGRKDKSMKIPSDLIRKQTRNVQGEIYLQ